MSLTETERARAAAAPAPADRGLSVLQGAAMLVGVVVGIGIFKTPGLVAQHASSGEAFLLLWLAGGLVTLVGALCYAELGSAHPSSGGEVHYLQRAYGPGVGFLFGWARMTVIQSGAIAAVAFVFGDYASAVLPAGRYSPALYAGLAILLLTALQLRGTALSGRTQLVLTIATIGAVLIVAALGFGASGNGISAPAGAPPSGTAAMGLAMVFILLTYGGWTEAAYLSGEVREPRRNMPRVLLIGTAAVTGLYLLVNAGLLAAFGLEGLRRSELAAADLVSSAAGPGGATLLAVLVCATSLSTLNATLFTGARSIQALGRLYPMFARLSQATDSGVPRPALLAQAGIALALVAGGAFARDGFTAMVEYTAPVFWLFLLLVGISMFLFRGDPPERERPFRAPLYPLTPLVFCATSLYLLYASLNYTGAGALVGVAVLAAGLPLLLIARR